MGDVLPLLGQGILRRLPPLFLCKGVNKVYDAAGQEDYGRNEWDVLNLDLDIRQRLPCLVLGLEYLTPVPKPHRYL